MAVYIVPVRLLLPAMRYDVLDQRRWMIKINYVLFHVTRFFTSHENQPSLQRLFQSASLLGLVVASLMSNGHAIWRSVSAHGEPAIWQMCTQGLLIYQYDVIKAWFIERVTMRYKGSWLFILRSPIIWSSASPQASSPKCMHLKMSCFYFRIYYYLHTLMLNPQGWKKWTFDNFVKWNKVFSFKFFRIYTPHVQTIHEPLLNYCMADP